jgi:hypothetical protein
MTNIGAKVPSDGQSTMVGPPPLCDNPPISVLIGSSRLSEAMPGRTRE